MSERFNLQMQAQTALDEVVACAAEVISSRIHHDLHPENAHGSDSIVYAEENLAIAARKLTRATEALPAQDQPVGWREL